MLELIYSFYSNNASGLITGLVLLGISLLFYRGFRGWRRALSALSALLAILMSIGGASHLYRSAQIDKRLPPPGEMVDIGGYRLHVLAEGPRGGIPVVWFAGGHAGGIAVHQLHRRVRDEMRSILVDRPGSGWSDTGPFPRTTRREVDEILQALAAAGEKGPFIFAGHSFGGLLAANIAYRHPEETAAVALLDATPLDVIFYGADREGLSSFVATSRRRGLMNAFGLYRPVLPSDVSTAGGSASLEDISPMPVVMALATRNGQMLATASAFEELTADGLRDRAFDIAVYDGMLGDTPLYLIAPKDDPTTRPYVESVVGSSDDADRFQAMLRAARERYLSASSNSHRIVTPDGTGHQFPDTHPDFVADTLRQIQRDIGVESPVEGDPDAAQWYGPYGGVPPFDSLTAADMAAAMSAALHKAQESIDAIRDNSEPPDFSNTVLAMERSAEPLRQLEAVLQAFTSTATTPAWREVAAQQLARLSTQRDETAQDPVLFARIQEVSNTTLSADQRRLLDAYLQRAERVGAQLAPLQQKRLRDINAELARLRQDFAAHIAAEEQELAIYVDDAAELDGLTPQQVEAAATGALQRGRQGQFAIPIQRPRVMEVLRGASSRALRESVWRAWVSRGSNDGEYDNRPIMSQILALRGEKAVLLGYPNFAAWQTHDRMIGNPQAAQELLMDTWRRLLPVTERQIAELTELAGDELGGDSLQPWDLEYYQARARARDFAVDMDDLRQYFALENVVEAMFWSAGELYGLRFQERDDIPVVHSTVRVFDVSRAGETLGAIYLDLFAREGKGPSSWSSQYRSYADFNADDEAIERQTQLPLVALHSAVTPSGNGGTVYVPWERANVIFHEFGHTLQTLQNRAPYPSIGPLALPWDFIEAPSLLHERWFMDRDLLKRFMVNADGVAIPDSVIDRLEASLRAERPIMLTLNFLASALVDIHLHTLADGRLMDVVSEEASFLNALGLPQAVDASMYAAHAFHTFSEQYAAGLYTYLWSNVIAADAAQAFHDAPDGLWDVSVALRWRELLEQANRQPIEVTWKTFRGRAPDNRFLFEAYGLED